MDEHRFDELTKALAGSDRAVSRRQVLKGIAGAVAGAALATVFPKRSWADDLGNQYGNSVCAHFCHDLFGDTVAAGACTSAAARLGGLCYQCGPAAPAGHPVLCGTVCCQPGEICQNGSCVQPRPPDVCTPASSATCGALAACGDSGAGCVCLETVEGSAFCHLGQSCEGSQTCSSTSECPEGYACAVSPCCGDQSICIRPCPTGTSA